MKMKFLGFEQGPNGLFAIAIDEEKFPRSEDATEANVARERVIVEPGITGEDAQAAAMKIVLKRK